ncbi:chromosome segregation protein SMC [Candidatus Bathyarchaeota archaeon]|nr:MAG: chromosome segregation protein SMC [Candidatus Bathyarchaeota archaeon]
MVYIQKIVMKNFKSFGGSVRLNLQPGFNVITGPNGSGKSNVIDAVQFVFGELGSRRMRVPDLSGLIFDGADESGTKKARTAQVTIYFDNSDRGLAVDKKIVSVSRKIDQQGKSKYFLNGRRTSRRAVLDLLEMAGISPGGYNIVLQGTATRLSDLTPSERMRALEDLIGITEYDEKKAEAKVRLAEAERKIEIASARIDEVRKRVNELERQRNDAIRYRLLLKEERKLNALKLSSQISQLESKIEALGEQIAENEGAVAKLEEERGRLIEERNAARARWEEFNKEANEKGNTRLPLLKSDLVGKRTLKASLEARLKEIESRKQSLQKGIEQKLAEIERSRKEIEEKRLELLNLTKLEAQVDAEIAEKEAKLRELNEKISTLRKSAETNQRRAESLTESLVPMQESLSGLEIEINRHLVNQSSLKAKIEELEQKKIEVSERGETLKEKIEQFEALKAAEFRKLEGLLHTMEEQVKRQKSIRSTIEGASKLAKEAETTITQFSAKRDLWKKIVTEEKAQARIKEMGEAGALPGYHGILRSLVKIDLKYQRAATTSSNGWIKAIVVDDIETALECVERLKKTKLGMTRFLPLKNLRPPRELPEIEEAGVIGPIPRLIRYDPRYAPVVNLVWGDTFIVEDRSAALRVVGEGYRAVTLSGDVYEPDGGLIGGYYRRPPDFSKLIPSEESVKVLSETIRKLRERLRKRMNDLKLSGESLRRFDSFLDQSKKTVEGIDEQIRETEESIKRLERNIGAIDEKIGKLAAEMEREQGLIAALRGRREKTLQEIERTKAEIAELKALKPSDVAGLELESNSLSREVAALREKRGQLRSDISVQTNLIDRYLELKIAEAEGQISRWREEIASLDAEHADILKRIGEIASDIEELQKILDEVTSEVESTSRVMEQHQRTLRQIDRQIEQIEARRERLVRRKMELSVEVEKLRLQCEQRYGELASLGFEDKLSLDGVDLDRVERTLRLIRAEKASLGAINQLAEEQYREYVGNYKQMSIRINELEEEKASILRFIDEVEREKQEHFMKAFNEVCENFSNIFAKLTGGGDGRLELQKPEDPFSAGVDLYIQFPGKPMRLASGASGGERSVAAIAYLLAIQRFLKAPFYLFDEIDAHLDDLNVSRLADVLRENALESQFIVVTLKDVMVHNAERIYGVFNQGGRSRVLALPMKMEVAL